MNTNTGEVAAMSVLAAELEARQKSRPAERRRRTRSGAAGPRTVIKPIDPANLADRARHQLEATGRTRISRNSPCPCGSRKRFKRCCMTVD